MPQRYWDGRTVHFGETSGPDRRNFELAMTGETSRKLALGLAKMKQTYFNLDPAVEEILSALNYVLVADPASVAEHRRMEAGKGMTPDGGHKPPEYGVNHGIQVEFPTVPKECP